MYEVLFLANKPIAQPKTEKLSDLESLEYIASMLTELQAMAKSSNFNMLSYLIDIARLESLDRIIRGKNLAISHKC